MSSTTRVRASAWWLLAFCFVGLLVLSVTPIGIVNSFMEFKGIEGPIEVRVFQAVFVIIATIGLPLIGALLIHLGMDYITQGGFQGLIPGELLGVALVLVAGPASILWFPISIFVYDHASVVGIVNGVVSLLLALAVAFVTFTLHAGTELVRNSEDGENYELRRDRLVDWLIESVDP